MAKFDWPSPPILKGRRRPSVLFPAGEYTPGVVMRLRRLAEKLDESRHKMERELGLPRNPNLPRP